MQTFQIDSQVRPAIRSSRWKGALATETTMRLDWIPMGSPRLRPPANFSAEQRGWWWSLFWTMFDQGEPQGFLTVTSDIWTVAGAHDRQRWDAHAARVMAAFDVADVAGQHAIFFPPLIQVLEIQRRKLLKRQGRGAFSKFQTRESDSLSLDFDSGSKKKKENGRETCARHPESGLTNWGTCWACYAERRSEAG